MRTTWFERFDVTLSSEFRSSWAGNVRASGTLGWLIAFVFGLMSPSCGSSHAVFELTAPSNVVAGAAFAVTVTAVVNGRRDTVINSPIQFTSSDTSAVLPSLYFFTATDAGSHTFTGIILMTPGSQTITVTDAEAPPITGTTQIMVSAGSFRESSSMSALWQPGRDGGISSRAGTRTAISAK